MIEAARITRLAFMSSPISCKHSLFQEYVGVRGKDQTKEWLVSEKERFDNDLDRNKDGYLDDAEIGSWIVPSNDEIAQVTL